MLNHIRLEAGTYRAITDLCVLTLQGRQELSWEEYEAGEEFEVPEMVNGFWKAAGYNRGEEPTPQYEKIS